MKRPELDKRVLKRSLLSATSKLIGVGLGAGAGDIIHRLVGGGFNGWTIALIFAAISFVLMVAADYEREKSG